MELAFRGEVFEWRGPAPYFYVAVPEEESEDIRAIAEAVTYGWGVIPVRVQVGDVAWSTSLFPKDGRYLVPLKAAVRRQAGVETGDIVALRLTVGGADGP